MQFDQLNLDIHPWSNNARVFTMIENTMVYMREEHLSNFSSSPNSHDKQNQSLISHIRNVYSAKILTLVG